ncbi:hypothetical protein [Pajaroellobacter abortibovis]|uniref:hypothetical protein n=1 Tax=Pajaroellobacter abortibovis TaxID=1882918 RepID=UPI0012EBE4C5|nr:hypothetical protein [Pajaroellobacter abortibovis]
MKKRKSPVFPKALKLDNSPPMEQPLLFLARFGLTCGLGFTEVPPSAVGLELGWGAVPPSCPCPAPTGVVLSYFS